ncbi:MAG: hypothetical protein AABX02_01565, partial [archaeon]
MPGPKRIFSERTRARLQKMREGTTRILVSAKNRTKTGAVKTRELARKGMNATVRTWKSPRGKRWIIGTAAALALAGVAYYAHLRMSRNGTRYLERPAAYIEYVRENSPMHGQPELEA